MPVIFSTAKKDLNHFFEMLSQEEIKDCCERKIYYRGREYYESGAVTDVTLNADKTSLTAIVNGSESYAVQISLGKAEISAKCNCPYGGICKHIIALLIYAHHEINFIEPASSASEVDIKQHLQTLSKTDLIDLVVKYAPPQYFVKVKNSFSGVADAQSIFKKTEHSIQKIFNSQGLLYDPNDFENAILKEIKKLSGLEKHLTEELGNLILYIIREVDKAIYEGYLYDHYNDETFELPQEFNELILTYTLTLSYLKKTAFLAELDSILRESEYDIFGDLQELFGKSFTEEDIPYLKDLLINKYASLSVDLVESYYQKVCPLLSDEEKEKILPVLIEKDGDWLIEYAQLLYNGNRQKESLNVVGKWLNRNEYAYGKENVYCFYLDLLKRDNNDLSKVTKKAIADCSTHSMLQKIADLLPDNLPAYEVILEERNAGELLTFLERSGRLKDALTLIRRRKDIWESQTYNFFKAYKKDFPAEAEEFFYNIIEKNLEHSGDNYYYNVADAIEQIKKVNAALASKLRKDICLNYKRRKKLVSILEST